MPLIKSSSPKVVGENIKREMAAGKPRRQTIAIALDVQRRARKADGGAVEGFDTRLPPDAERAYLAWKLRNAPNDSGADYDLRGAFAAGLQPAANGHWPDTFKKPNHPTFSNESIYSIQRPELAGRWSGENYTPAVVVQAERAGMKNGGRALSVAYRIQNDAKRRKMADGGAVDADAADARQAAALRLARSGLRGADYPDNGERVDRGFNAVAGGLRHFFATPGDVAAGKYTVQPEVPGQWSEADEFRQQDANRRLTDWGASTAMGMIGMGRLPGASPPNSVGIFGGRLSQTADKAALARAEEMAASGAPRDAIWSETGWFRGPDKKWRYEIPDDKAAMAHKDIGSLPRSGPNPASDFIQHDALFGAYPGVGAVPTSVVRPADVGGAMLPGGRPNPQLTGAFYGRTDANAPIFGIGEHVYVSPGSSTPKRVMLHELQHRIQDVEGFAGGASPHAMQDHLKTARDTVGNKVQQIGDAREIAAIYAPGDDLISITTKLKAKYGGGEMAKLVDEYAPGALSAFERLGRPSAQKLERMTSAASKEYKDAHRLTPHDAYRRIAGEVESRNVESRMNMTPEQRRASPPWTTEDVPSARQIVRQPPPDEIILGSGDARGSAATSKDKGMKNGGAIALARRMAAGGVPETPFYARAGARSLQQSGMIHSPVGGRTDALPANVKSGSYVLPADAISGIGQGNSIAGANAFNKLFKMGPYGAADPHPAAPGGMRAPVSPGAGLKMKMSTAGMMRGRKGFADGGSPDNTGAPVDIMSAGGEFIVPVHKVAELGGGSVERGHELLDSMVAHIRRQTIKTLRHLPKPKKG
jgi:hypothetical protein